MSNLLRPPSALQPVIVNMVWLTLDNFLRILVGIMVGAWVARYLGPAQFGELSYILAYVAFFQGLARLGLDSIAIRDMSRDPAAAPIILGTSARLRLVAGFLCWALALGGITLLRPRDLDALALVAIVAGAMVFQTADVIDLWFQSRTQSRRTVIAKSAALTLSAAIRVGLIMAGAPLVAFAFVVFFDAAFLALAMFQSYRCYPTEESWAWRTPRACAMLRESWPYLLSTLTIIIYLRIDQIMLRDMVGDYAVGIYSAAQPLATIWYFIPVTLCASIAPALTRIKSRSEENYRFAMNRLFSLMWWYSIPLSIGVALLSGKLVGLLYGEAFAASAVIVATHVFANTPVALGVALQQWTVNEGCSDLGLYRTAMGALANVMLNYCLIPSYGALGAAIATVAAQYVSSLLSNLILDRNLFWRQVRCLCDPFRAQLYTT